MGVRYFVAETGANTDCQNFLTRVWIDCQETRKVYEFFGCYWHGDTCLPFRDVTTMCGDILADVYEHTTSNLEHITRGGYLDGSPMGM